MPWRDPPPGRANVCLVDGTHIKTAEEWAEHCMTRHTPSAHYDHAPAPGTALPLHFGNDEVMEALTKLQASMHDDGQVEASTRLALDLAVEYAMRCRHLQQQLYQIEARMP